MSTHLIGLSGSALARIAQPSTEPSTNRPEWYRLKKKIYMRTVSKRPIHQMMCSSWVREAIKKNQSKYGHYPEGGGEFDPCPKVFGALFLMSLIFGQKRLKSI